MKLALLQAVIWLLTAVFVVMLFTPLVAEMMWRLATSSGQTGLP